MQIILIIAVLVFLATKVLTYENLEVVGRCLNNLQQCKMYLTPVIAISLLTLVILEYGRIAFASTLPLRNKAKANYYWIDIGIFIFVWYHFNV